MAQIPDVVAKRGIFEQEFKSLIETKNIWSKVATILRSTAKNIYSPFTSVAPAKAYTTNCVVPVSPLTVSVDELVLDRSVGNAITDCKEELDWANFDITAHIRTDLYASVMKKANELATADFTADATIVSGTVDMSSADKIREFVISVKVNSGQEAVGLSQKIDGATVVRSEKHGKPFIAAGSNAFVKIFSAVAGSMALSTTQGLKDGDIIDTPYGVYLLNLGGTEDNADRIIYGTAGVPTMAYRNDMIEVDMGEFVSKTTYTETSPDLDLENGDPLLEKTWYMYAKTKGKNGIFSNVQPLVKTQLATFA